MNFQYNTTFIHGLIKSNLVNHIKMPKFETFENVLLNGICNITKKVKSDLHTSNINNEFLQNLLCMKCKKQFDILNYLPSATPPNQPTQTFQKIWSQSLTACTITLL
jgi:hypothetical protein